MGGIRVAVIYGSTRPGRFCDTVVRWTVERLAASEKFQLDVIDPAEPSPAQSMDERPTQSLQQRLGQADAFVIVTPEYNHGYPAPLKALIDSSGAEWHAKPVAFVSYGGASGGLRAVEQLRLVFAELHAVTIRDSVSFPVHGSNSMNPVRCGILSALRGAWRFLSCDCTGGQPHCAVHVPQHLTHCQLRGDTIIGEEEIVCGQREDQLPAIGF